MNAPQNVYDNPSFFECYRTLRQQDTGLNGALEVPALRSLLPSLAGVSVLDLGCGFGDFARYAREQGARLVTAVDLSRKMLEEAVRLTSDPKIHFVNAAIEGYVPEAGVYDCVVSSLALHYVADYQTVAKRVFMALRPKGTFVFSVEHPMCTAYPVGWVRDVEGRAQHWPVDHYHDEGPRQTRWFVENVVKYHRTIETYVATLLTVGFQIDALSEPKPTSEALSIRPELIAELRRPPFLMVSASRL